MVSSADIPRTRQQLAAFAQNEKHLLVAIVVVASRNERSLRDVHDRSWAAFTQLLTEVQCLGAPATVGLVEGLLLVAENLPRNASGDMEVHGTENRQAWMLVGAAIRCASGLGLEKVRVMERSADPSCLFRIQRI